MKKPIDVVTAHYDAILRRDLDAILETISPDVVWEFPASPDIPFSGHYEGRGGAREFFRKIGSTVDVKEFEVESMISHGDHVIVFGHERFQVHATGLEWATDWVQSHMVSNGLIVRFREYADTAAIARAYRGVAVP